MALGQDIAVSNPPKLHLQDLVTLERLDAQFNPASLERMIHVEWVKQKVPGLSHRKYQYDYTDNQKTTLELIFDSFFTKDTTPLEEATKFVESLCYTKAKGDSSRFLLVWPGVLSIVCVIDGDVKFKSTRFNSEAKPTYTTISIPIAEIRDSRLTSEGVREWGSIRSNAKEPRS